MAEPGLISGASANSSLAMLSFSLLFAVLAEVAVVFCLYLLGFVSDSCTFACICKLFGCVTYILLVIAMVLKQGGCFLLYFQCLGPYLSKIKENAITLGLISGGV